MTLDTDALRAALDAHGAVARVVVAEARGSAPREAGAAMLVWADGIDGTIGGGRLEWEAIARARDVLHDGSPRVDRIPLGPALGQCCGGAVTLVTERLETVPPDPWTRPAPGLRDGVLTEHHARPERHLWLWGAGHVGRAVAATVAPLPGIGVTWVDVAPERFPDAVPPGVDVLVAAEPPLAMARAPESAEHLILTHDHDLDLALCHAALTRGFRACGLIGSDTKWARFRARLRALRHEDARIDRIACPIGDPTLGKHPQAIAIGVAAGLLSLK